MVRKKSSTTQRYVVVEQFETLTLKTVKEKNDNFNGTIQNVCKFSLSTTKVESTQSRSMHVNVRGIQEKKKEKKRKKKISIRTILVLFVLA